MASAVNGAGAGTPVNLGTQPVSLLEGYSGPPGVQQIIVSFLHFSKEKFLVYKPGDDKALLGGPKQKPIQYEVISAQPGEATIDALCKRTGDAFEQNLENIAKLREPSCGELCLMEEPTRGVKQTRLGQEATYYIACGLGRPVQEALNCCVNPSYIQIWSMNFSDQALQSVLQSKQAKVVEINCNTANTRNIKLNLPHLEYLGLYTTAFQTIDLTQCPNLREFVCIMPSYVSQSIQIDTRGLRGCKVHASTRHAITLLTKDAQGKEITVQGAQDRDDDIVDLYFVTPAQDPVDQKKEGAQA